MGKMVDDMAADHGFEVVGRVDVGRNEWRSADVAVDFTTASALESNFQKYVDHKMSVVIGTTGWGDSLRRLQSVAESSGLGVVASANFSVGVNVFQMVVEEAARRMKAHPQFGAWIHEAHHSAKRDAPSG